MLKQRIIYFVNNQLFFLFLQLHSHCAYISFESIISCNHNYHCHNICFLLSLHVLCINMTQAANYDNNVMINVINFSLFDYHHDKYKLRVKSVYAYNEQSQFLITMLSEFSLMSVIITHTLHMLTFFSAVQTVITASTHYIFLMINLLSTCIKHMQLLQLSSQWMSIYSFFSRTEIILSICSLLKLFDVAQRNQRWSVSIQKLSHILHMLNMCRCWVDINEKEMCKQIFNLQFLISFAYASHLLDICLLFVSFVNIFAIHTSTSVRYLHRMCLTYAEFIQFSIHLNVILVR